MRKTMQSTHYTFGENPPRYVHVWRPEGEPKAVIHIAHGMAEHGARYERLAESLTAKGYVVFANDHLGHGKTAQDEEALGFFAEHDGWSKVVRDLGDLLDNERSMHPGLPMVLISHSMGSLMAQQLMYERGELFDAVVLSGTQGPPPFLAKLGRGVARIERKRFGAKGRSKLLTKMSFDDFNRKFRPTRTGFDWLSRDPEEVDKYIADPLCGFMVTTSLWVDLLDALFVFAAPENQRKIRKDLPVYLFSGDRDPVGDNGKGIRALVTSYKKAGLRDVTMKLYPEARHETLNEVNRKDVTDDLLEWIDRALAKLPS